MYKKSKLPMQERYPLQHKPPCCLDATSVRAPMFKAIFRIFSQDLKSF